MTASLVSRSSPSATAGARRRYTGPLPRRSAVCDILVGGERVPGMTQPADWLLTYCAYGGVPQGLDPVRVQKGKACSASRRKADFRRASATSS
jgi:hypothetical protein